MPIPYFVADSARATILRPLASSAFGSYSLTLPEGIDLEDVHDFEAPGNELGHVATLTRSRRVGGLARRFVRADVAVTAADAADPDWFPESNVDAVLEEASTRVSSDFFLESDITKAGLGPWVPFVDFKVGDKARVNIWGHVVTLPITRVEPIISDHDVVDWLVHLGGQLVSDDDAREVENENLRKAFLQDRRELAGIEGQVKAVDKKAEDAKSTADTAQGTAETAKSVADDALAAATDADGVLRGLLDEGEGHLAAMGVALDSAGIALDDARGLLTDATALHATIQPMIDEGRGHATDALAQADRADAAHAAVVAQVGVVDQLVEDADAILDAVEVEAAKIPPLITQARGHVTAAKGHADRADLAVTAAQGKVDLADAAMEGAQAALTGATNLLADIDGAGTDFPTAITQVVTAHNEVLGKHQETLVMHGEVITKHSEAIKAATDAARDAVDAAAAVTDAVAVLTEVQGMHGEVLVKHGQAIKAVGTAAAMANMTAVQASETAKSAALAAQSALDAVNAVAQVQALHGEVLAKHEDVLIKHGEAIGKAGEAAGSALEAFNAMSGAFDEWEKAELERESAWEAHQAVVGQNSLNIDSLEKQLVGMRQELERVRGRQWDIVSLGGNGTVDDFTTTTSGHDTTLTVAGTWTGRIIPTLEHNPVSSSNERIAPIIYTWDVGVNRAFVHKRPLGQLLANVRLDYRRDAAQVRQSNITLRNHATSQDQWTVLHSLTVPKSAEGIASIRVGWHATTNGDQYGVRIRVGGTESSGGTVVANDGPRTGLGPLTPLGNGYRVQTASNQSFQVPAGAVVRLESYSTGITATRREVRDATLNIAWIDRG